MLPKPKDEFLNMDNIFYAPPESFSDNRTTVTISGQEAQHITKVLRKREGDVICVADGVGRHFRCSIAMTTRQQVLATCLEEQNRAPSSTKKVLALGALKKRDRLEFAIEKAVELGATEICVFNAEHSERNRLKEDRLELVVTSAFKQSGRYWMPQVTLLDSLEEVLNHYVGFKPIMAHEKVEVKQPEFSDDQELLLLVGPEGGFSDSEVGLIESTGGLLISLGMNRLRAETAVSAILSLLLFR